ncbi:wd40 repeat-containing protein : WD40 repeat-containing protein OS=Singulisphaera acidiphila (strain ATCC BAA-1392 / DSM 18658 / VKM B-2454 / MOB10) GN=Sinac_7396 PE=3 SV=1: Pkinase: PSCyt1: PSCyt1 [Gemmataceae bacterium]|nr:wd40 repeat-containing protein : WD40 repeat-containing protein OS=Singulisphaera acidiphila (strain ATCC BAA-1392 / DSM 18658 / VKM B-2454 / MOB10) GN=Sinac_7396 PE=3 SV=1: Pkinase: PSCyt1: PSCyt1 [Gemmataceae bacterium]VTU01226.1 wd40 repeat-containing protein : WD40 repeat-containing protein OS=Singulisphaera acidiphila (strain ATCC BAA-1392 / DSM 18658 / VKM B-2454 / MOB10) GN=Sinac_7396 PE=3 SV=1: Pkinase: PSCyt1: PSCyt1 [Gemmataceae bacterium]
MSTADVIDELLLRWQDRRRRGLSASVGELCEHHPELVGELTQRVKAFESMEALLSLGPKATRTGGDSAPAGVPGHLAEKLLPLGYELLDVIDQGGMGIVYRAVQVKLRRVVALKMIAGFRAGPKNLARFRAEAEAIAHLQHPHIVQVHEVGEVDGHSFFSMEYLAGGTLATVLERGPLAPAAAAEVVEVLARAVHHAHVRGVVHRDLKPGNVLFGVGSGEWAAGIQNGRPPSSLPTDHSPLPTGPPKVADFGLAKRLGADSNHTATGEVVGTPAYMAPEQAAGEGGTSGPAVDVYALGAILYEALTGRPPFQAGTVLGTLKKVVSDEPEPPRAARPAVPRDLDAVCLKCLEKRPGDRYPTAEALADDLKRFLAGRPVAARSHSRAVRAVRWCRRRPVLVALVAAVGLAPVAVWGGDYVAAERRRARAVAVAPQAREILQRHCYECHGANPDKVDRDFLALDRASLLDPHRKNVVPGHPDQSRLIQRIADGTMPPREEELRLPRVSSLELGILREWIAGGAPPFPPEDPGHPTPPVVPRSELAAEVKAITVRHCYECHQHENARAGILVLDHNLLTETRKVVVPGNPDESEFYTLLVAAPRDPLLMPPRSRPRMTPEEIDTVRRWIAAGAPPFPATEK